DLLLAARRTGAHSVEALTATVESGVAHRYRRRKNRRRNPAPERRRNIVTEPDIGAERLGLGKHLVPWTGFFVAPDVNPICRHIDREAVEEALREIELNVVFPTTAAEIEHTVLVVGAKRERNKVHGRHVALMRRVINKP